MKLRLNLSTTPPENKRPFLAGSVLLGTLGVLALMVLSHAAFESWRSSRMLRAEIARLQDQIQADSAKRQELETYFRSPAAQQVLDRSAFLNSLIDARSFPWTKIFMDLEQTLPAGVRVVSISPHLVNGRAEVELQVGAASDDSEVLFLKAMENSPVFSGMVVKNEKHQDRSTTPDKIVVNLTVWYSTT
ncbi:MAG: hypothetical protein ACLQMT_04820 [Candidatus Acidiferrales bacterium]